MLLFRLALICIYVVVVKYARCGMRHAACGDMSHSWWRQIEILRITCKLRGATICKAARMYTLINLLVCVCERVLSVSSSALSGKIFTCATEDLQHFVVITVNYKIGVIMPKRQHAVATGRKF